MTDTITFSGPSRRPLTVKAGAPGAAAIVAFFIFEIVFLVGLQKFGFPISDFTIEFSLPALYFGLGALAFSGRVRLDLVRMLLYLAFAASAVICSYAGGGEFSLNSLMLVLAIYFPFMFVIVTEMSVYKKCIQHFPRRDDPGRGGRDHPAFDAIDHGPRQLAQPG